MNVTEFIKKWRKAKLTERSASQQHFLDLCDLLDHPKPAAADPDGSTFTFEKGVHKRGGGDGWADVWKKGFFGWEYKGKHKDLAAAYAQLLQYAEALETPRLLVVCDMARIVVHTHFNDAPHTVHEIPLDTLGDPASLTILRAVFHEPEKLRPEKPIDWVTEEAARRIAELAQSLRARGLDPHPVARFLDRIVFCLFAEDIGLLPDNLFSRILDKGGDDPERFAKLLGQLFDAMAHGGDFGIETIRHFNGNLFMDGPVLELTEAEIEAVAKAARLDWGEIKPSIFGTLFERGLDPSKRAQLGAHYTSEEDIKTLVEPVVLSPLRREWAETRQTIENLLATGKKKPTGREKKAPTGARLRKARDEAVVLINRFLERLSRVTVLDPACGSGNFLYVTLQMLKNLEKEVVTCAADRELGGFLPRVLPTQLHGIEINPYAFELAQMTVWIGWLQWTRHNGFGWPADPVLRPMDTFENKDAILDLTDPDHPKEPTWPKVDFIVGNPPFLGGKFLRRELGSDYVDVLFTVWQARVPHECDLCCYWFEKARAHLQGGRCHRAGLLATQGIRGGANRRVTAKIKETGGIFFAESDKPWVLDGASVHVSMVGFDAGSEQSRTLDGAPVDRINADLTAHADLTKAAVLAPNSDTAFMGTSKGGAFDIDEPLALSVIRSPNPHGRPNSDVVVPWVNARDITSRKRDMWIIDFGVGRSEGEAALFEAPFEYVRERVKPKRDNNRRESYRRLWWQHVEGRPAMRARLSSLPRFVCTPRVSKHRAFVWLTSPTLPDSATFVFARDDDLFFGVLQSQLHEVWARGQGTQLRERESGFRYTPTTCFETFPLPEPTDQQAAAIAEAARELNALREEWLNPSEWVREEVLEFPGSADGPWARYIVEDGVRGSVVGGRGPEHRTPTTEHRPRIGTVRYPRLVPRDADCAKKLKKRTLTNLYNERPTWLDLAHRKLDAAVFAAYGWPPALDDEAILEKLLALNLERAAAGS